MIDSTTRPGLRLPKALGLGGVSVLLLMTSGCKTTDSASRNPTISAHADRSSAGVLQGLKVDGQGFSPNGSVHVTVVLAASGSTASPYVEEDVQADANGKLKYERRPLKCPEPANYGRGSWVTVSARDTASGISGEALLTPGQQPDCGA